MIHPCNLQLQIGVMIHSYKSIKKEKEGSGGDTTGLLNEQSDLQDKRSFAGGRFALDDSHFVGFELKRVF